MEKESVSYYLILYNLIYICIYFYIFLYKFSKEESRNLKQQMLDAEIEPCTFTPNIYTKSMRSSSCGPRERKAKLLNQQEFYEKNIKWKNDIELKSKELFVYKINSLNQYLTYKDLQEKLQLENCHFQPNINKRSKEILLVNEAKNEFFSKNKEDTENIEKQSNDYIYKKNISWLKKLQEDKKIMELELEEKRLNHNIVEKPTINYNINVKSPTSTLVADLGFKIKRSKSKEKHKDTKNSYDPNNRYWNTEISENKEYANQHNLFRITSK